MADKCICICILYAYAFLSDVWSRSIKIKLAKINQKTKDGEFFYCMSFSRRLKPVFFPDFVPLGNVALWSGKTFSHLLLYLCIRCASSLTQTELNHPTVLNVNDLLCTGTHLFKNDTNGAVCLCAGQVN